ncbi:4Fe-4S dicluster domain-containing protein [Clostridium thailandense]|uniref:4Fe-4S binding protein n=1 Tax=Clostridium thailandense TaxID=2794346 RepID=A0A949U154_9CLOT|nr:4Fe-4S dicluster domain-containing protein [Clostridium thailandense]MBV7274543.1 4Fe-4S binding protein [Clostridium thailandense]
MDNKKTLQIDNERCVGCRKCENSCAMGAITIVNEHGYININLCINCGSCISVCHKYAIR